MNAKLDKLLNTDILAEANKFAGVDSGSEEAQNAGYLGLALAMGMGHNAAKKAALIEADDVGHHTKLAEYKRIIEKYGFEKVFKETFISKRGETDTLFVYAHRKGLILSFDTYWGHLGDEATVNSAYVYYNWIPNDEKDWYVLTASGGFENRDTPEKSYWRGSHDAREGLIHNLNKLESGGKFIPKWKKWAFNQLNSYNDWGREDKSLPYTEQLAATEALTYSRINQMPEWVREMVGGPR